MDDLLHTVLTILPTSFGLITKNLTTLASHMLHFASPVLSLLSSNNSNSRGLSPELLNAALLVFTIYISLQILSLASRWVYSMILSMIRITIVTLLAFLAFSLYNRGFERTQDDLWVLWENFGGGEFVENVLNGQNARKTGGYYSSGSNRRAERDGHY